MDLTSYLRRIDYGGPQRTDLETLRALHRAHLMAIPYENFDVQLKRPLTTDPVAAFAKLVERGRGGWCYEHNGVFALALQAMGFAVTRLCGDGAGPASHLVLRVDLDGQPIICDVGFADGPIEPYAMVQGPFEQQGFRFALELLEDGFRLHNHPNGITPGYTARGPDEAAMSETCAWLQTAEDSPFVQHTVACARTPEGHVISLVGRVLRVIRPDEVETSLIPSAGAYVETLRTRFRLDFAQAAQFWPEICRRHEAYEARRSARLR